MVDTEEKTNNLELFSYKEITIITSIFIGFWIGINLLFKFISSFFNRSVGTLWPVGKVELMIPTLFCFIFVPIVFISFLLILKLRSKYEFNLYIVVIIGILLIIGTSLFHGFWKGFVSPTEGSGGLTYYWDAIEIKDPIKFIITFNQRQNKLELHSRTHPPGAVLLYYLLYRIFVFPALISLVILIISSVFSGYFLYEILKRELDDELALYITFLFLLIPAIQIYYLANNYAIIASLILGIVYFYMHPNYKIKLIGTISCLFLIAFLTFMVVFILGVIFCFEAFKSYKIKRITNFKNIFIISLSLFLIYVFFLVVFTFNYIESFIFASRQENPSGFRLFADPFDYFVSRVENVLEILFLFGPFLFVLFLRGNSILKKKYSDYYLLMISAIVVLLALFLTGAYRTGETARACSYIYPFLLFPVAFYLNEKEFPLSEKNKLLILVFIQTIIMQLIGFYKW